MSINSARWKIRWKSLNIRRVRGFNAKNLADYLAEKYTKLYNLWKYKAIPQAGSQQASGIAFIDLFCQTLTRAQVRWMDNSYLDIKLILFLGFLLSAKLKYAEFHKKNSC